MVEVEDTGSVVNDAVELPPSTSTPGSKYSASRLFGRQRTVHDLLGGGKSADILLWRQKHMSAGVLGVATLIYLLFEWCGYTLLSVLCNAVLFVTVILFLWSNGAALLNRPPPRIPEVHLSEDMVQHVAQTVKIEFNKAMQAFRAIIVGRDHILFIKTVVGLWLLSVIGGWCDLLTLLYIGVVGGHILPVVYDKYEDQIEHYLKVVGDEAKKQYKKIDEIVMKKIPRAAPKEKKSE